MSFYIELLKELLSASKNNFSQNENYDHIRFGKMQEPSPTLMGMVRNKMAKAFEARGYSVYLQNKGYEEMIAGKLALLEPHLTGLDRLYSLLADEVSKKLMLQVIAFRILGYYKVKLPLNTPDFWNGIKEIEELADPTKFLKTKFMDWRLPFVDLKKKGIPVQLYFAPVGVYTDFFLKQYEFRNGKKAIKAEDGDIVVDAGGCWGDTALYFAQQVGGTGKVYTYEFIPSNLEILNTNLSLNPDLQQRVNVINRPVWETSDTNMFFVDEGPGSKVFMEESRSYDGKVPTLSIDDMVDQYHIPRIDFIKMDIEGAEPYALRGARKTIERFKPKLAIAIYHSLSDFVNIPKYIDELGLGYKLHLGHYTIHEEESIIFAEIPE